MNLEHKLLIPLSRVPSQLPRPVKGGVGMRPGVLGVPVEVMDEDNTILHLEYRLEAIEDLY